MTRFSFGENWSSFVRTITPEQILDAERHLRDRFQVSTLAGESFLDLGCGSGVFSLAACRLGATVLSVDRELDAVTALRQRDPCRWPQWTVRRADLTNLWDLLDLPSCTIIYAWGVLHHTGVMWAVLSQILSRLRQGDRLLLSLYHDQGWKSRGWRIVKRLYQRLSPRQQDLIVAGGLALHRVRPGRSAARGMDLEHDLRDWLGGWPYETAHPDRVRAAVERAGCRMLNEWLVGNRLGCNEYLITRTAQP